MTNYIWDEIGHDTFFKLIEQSETTHKMGHWIFDIIKPRMYWSKGMYDIHEQHHTEVTTFEEAIELGTEESKERITNDLATCLEYKNPVDEIYKIITTSGVEKCIRLVATPILENNEVARIYGSITDITKQQKVLNRLELKHQILSSISEAVFGVNLDGSIHYWNEAAEELFEIPSNIIETHRINELEVFSDVSSFLSVYKEGSKNNYSLVWQFKNNQDKIVFIDTSISPLLNEQIEVTGFIAISHDVTELKQREIRIGELIEEIQKRESKFKSLIDNGEDVACIINKEGILEYISENVQLVLGKKPNDLIGNRYLKYKSHEFLTLEQLNFQNILDQPSKTFKIEQQTTREDGNQIWIECIAHNAIKDTSIQGVIVSFRDITIKKQIIEEQKQARLLAEEMTAMKTNFLATMSHEIRTPLNGILGTAELMELEAVSDNIKDLVNIQKESGYRLLTTLNSILAMTKLEADNQDIQLNIVSVNQLIKDSINLYQSKAKIKGIILDYQFTNELYVKANLGMLSQCINNLVDNALKFTKKGTIQLRIFQENKDVIIEVQDTGIGISASYQERIFEPFWQAQMGQSCQYQGTGLGLSIVKRYIEFIGGSIQLESTINVGSIFKINLPVANMEQE